MLTDLECDVLRYIRQHDGKGYWYQLGRYFGTSHNLLNLARELRDKGMIEIRVNPSLDETERYWITAAGLEYLEANPA